MSYELNAGGKQLAEVIEKVTWSGDSKQVARKLVFTVANKDSDRFLPKVNINEGDQVQFLEDGKLLFSGPVFDIEKSGSGNVVTYTAFDLMFYVTKSDINRVFDNETPEAITSWICSHLGIPFGAAASTGIPVYMPWLGKKAYDGIMAAYTAASRKNGKKYIPLIKNATQLYVIEKGALCGVVLDGSYNLTEANYKTSLQNMVDRVLITDKDGNQIGVVEDTAAVAAYDEILKSELNVKDVELCTLEDAGSQGLKIIHELRVNARVAGKRLRKDVQFAIKASKSGAWHVDASGAPVCETPNGDITLEEGEYELINSVEEQNAEEAANSVSAALPTGGFVILDTELNDDLVAEGYTRDVIRSVQDARKAADLEISDRIALTLTVPADDVAKVEQFKDLITSETLATSFDLKEGGSELSVEVSKA